MEFHRTYSVSCCVSWLDIISLATNVAFLSCNHRNMAFDILATLTHYLPRVHIPITSFGSIYNGLIEQTLFMRVLAHLVCFIAL